MNEQAKTILDENILGALATINSDGSPLATPLHMVADTEALYWFSQPSAAHSQNVAREPRVSLTLFSPDTSQGPKGVYVSGQAQLLDEAERADVYALFEQRLGTVPAVFATASAYRLPIGTLDEQKSTGGCWYFYS